MTTANLTDTTQLRPGDRLSRTSYVEIVQRTPNGFKVKNESGFSWDIGGSIIANEMYTAHQYDEEVSVSRTEMVEILENAGDAIFTVTFGKKVSEKAVRDAIGLLLDSGENNTAAIRRTAKELLAGEQRTLIGYLVHTEPKMGRSQVVDLEKPTNSHRLRLVDHRTVTSLVLRNKKYVLK